MIFRHLSYKLEPSDLEEQFKQDGLKRDMAVAVAVLLLSIIFQILTIPTDRWILKGTDVLFVVWSIRFVCIGIAGVAFLAVRRCKTFNVFENILFAWAVLLVLAVEAANAMFPPDYTVHLAWDLIIAFAAYTLLPISITRQMIVSAIISIGDMVLFWMFKVLENPGELYDIFTLFFCVNILGIFASRELHRSRRHQYETFQHQTEANRRLEKALLDIKTLEGIIPICVYCKKIRDDEGYWNQIEKYIRDRSDVKFSHGVCEDCFKKLYDEID